jgi:chaperone required for assembly of F1-ATPase
VKKTPLQIVKERFGNKAALIEALQKFTHEDLWVNRLNSEKGLEHVSNAKLLRLHDTFSAVKEQFGNRFKLIDAILEAENRSKDTGYRERLEKYPVPRLFDLYRSVTRRKNREDKAKKD